MGGEQLRQLKEVCDEMLNAGIILIEKKMNNLMQLIAENKELYEIVGSTVEGFPYAAAWEALFSPDPEKGFRVNRPATREEMVAVIFCFMCEFEKDSPAQLPDMITSYFPANDVTESAKRFQHELLSPFVAALISLAEEHVPVEKVVLRGDKEYLFGEPCDVDEAMFEELYQLCADVVDAVAAQEGLPEWQKEELSHIIEGFLHGVATHQKRLISVLFLGMKYALIGFPQTNLPLVKIEQVLKNHWILN